MDVQAAVGPILTADPVRNCAQSKRLMRRLKGKSRRADMRAVNNLTDSLAGCERARRCAPGSVQPILFDPSAGMMLRAVVANNKPVPVVPVAPSRRRRPSRKSAALGADDEAMEWKGRQRRVLPPLPWQLWSRG